MSGPSAGWLGGVPGAAAAIPSGGASLRAAQAVLMTYVGQRVMMDLRLQLFDHVQRRVTLWLDPFAPDQSDQVARGLMGLAHGGIFGTGLGEAGLGAHQPVEECGERRRHLDDPRLHRPKPGGATELPRSAGGQLLGRPRLPRRRPGRRHS